MKINQNNSNIYFTSHDEKVTVCYDAPNVENGHYVTKSHTGDSYQEILDYLMDTYKEIKDAQKEKTNSF